MSIRSEEELAKLAAENIQAFAVFKKACKLSNIAVEQCSLANKAIEEPIEVETTYLETSAAATQYIVACKNARAAAAAYTAVADAAESAYLQALCVWVEM